VRQALGTEPPAGLASLGPADRARLAGLIEDCAERESKALDTAIEGGLSHLPRLLRAAVRSILFG
jgi:hypothetical protein